MKRWARYVYTDSQSEAFSKSPNICQFSTSELADMLGVDNKETCFQITCHLVNLPEPEQVSYED